MLNYILQFIARKYTRMLISQKMLKTGLVMIN